MPRQAVLEGWYVPEEGLWHIPLLSRKDIILSKEHTFLSKRSPLKILGDSEQPPLNQTCNVCEIKVQPEIIQYYHAVAGFPTKPTWINAIQNGHYSSWTGLTTKVVAKLFPESDET